MELAAAEARAAEVAAEGVALDKQLVATASETEVPVVRVLSLHDTGRKVNAVAIGRSEPLELFLYWVGF